MPHRRTIAAALQAFRSLEVGCASPSMAPLAAYAGSWGTSSPSPNIDQEEGDGGGGVGELFVSACDETFAVPQPMRHGSLIYPYAADAPRKSNAL